MNKTNAAPGANTGRLTGRRLLSVLLVLMMLLGMLPISALADGSWAIERMYYVNANEEPIALRYQVSEDTFSCEDSYHTFSDVPIYDVYVPEGVTQAVVQFSEETDNFNYAYGVKFEESALTYGTVFGDTQYATVDPDNEAKTYAVTLQYGDVSLVDSGWGVAPEFTDDNYACYVVFRFVSETAQGGGEAHTHSYGEGVVTTEPTCTAEGVKTFTCSCGDTKTEALAKLNHVDVKINKTQADGKDGLCDVCSADVNQAPVLKEGVTDVTATVLVGEAYLLSDLQAGRIFEDPEGDVLHVAGGVGGSGGDLGASSTNYYYNRSTDGGQTWTDELNFASSLFGSTTISLTETVPGTYIYRFYAKDSKGASSADNDVYWNLTLNVVTEALFDISFYISQDQNYATNGKVYPIIKLYPSDGKGNITGDEISFTNSAFDDSVEVEAVIQTATGEDAVIASNTVKDNYNMMYASVPNGWYVYHAWGWNADNEDYTVDLGGMQLRLPTDSNVDGNRGGGTDIYLRLTTINTTSKKSDNSYFGQDDYTASFICPIMQCTATVGTPYVKNNYTYYPCMLYAGGNSCLYNRYVYPTDTENYMFNQAINSTFAPGYTVLNSQSLSINAAMVYTVTVPTTADYQLYFQWNNFNTTEVEPEGEWKDNEDGTKEASFRISKGNANYTWRMTDTTGTYVTKAGWLSQLTAATEKAYSFEDGKTNKLSHDFSQVGTTTKTRDEADIQVFASESGAIAANSTTRIRAYRMWQLINSDTANIMIEPDFTWTKLSGPAAISYAEDDDNTEVSGGNSLHNWADINANGGTSIFAVRYDAIDVDTSNNSTHAGFYPATNPDRVAYVVVADALGTADAHIQYNGDFVSNSRGEEWDYIYDTWYYLRGDTSAVMDFTATGAEAVEYAIGTTDSTSMVSSLTGFTALTADANGKYYVPLAAFDHAANNYGGTVIIRLTDSNGLYSYRLVHVAGMTYSVANDTYPGETVVYPGNQVTITFDGLYRSINKISGIFNPTTFYLRYTADGTEVDGRLGQYQQMDLSAITFTVPADITFEEGESIAVCTYTNGYVYGSMYSAANPFGAMYYMTDTGVGTNFNAVTCSFAFQKLADVDVTVVKAPTCAVSFSVNAENAVITLTDESGNAVSPANGVYVLGLGNYSYTVTADGYIMEKGTLSVRSSDGDSKTVAITLREVNAATWDGTTTTAAVQNDDGVYEISTGAQLAWFAEQVNAGTGINYNAKLMSDISLNWNQWTPIGNSSKKYAGTFDGNGHAITDLYIASSSQYQALFGCVNNGTIKNLSVSGEVTGGNYSAGIVANLGGSGKVDSCANYADVTGKKWTGGIAGFQNGTTAQISNCYNVGNINGGANQLIGGISGGGATSTITSVITNCYNVGTVYSTALYGGAVSGITKTANVTNSYYLDGSWTGTKTASVNIVGTKKTAAELKAAASLLGEAYTDDTDNINNGYPILTWQATITEHVHTLIAHEAVAATTEAAGNLAYWSCSACGKFFSDAEAATEIEENSWVIPALEVQSYTFTLPRVYNGFSALTITGAEVESVQYTAGAIVVELASDTQDDAQLGLSVSTESAAAKISPTSVKVQPNMYGSIPHQTEYTANLVDGTDAITVYCYPGAVQPITMVGGMPMTMSFVVGHTLTAHEAAAPSCGVNGNTAYWSCSVCGKYYSNADASTEIEENSWVIAALGHTEETVAAVEATCTATGLTAGAKCSVCGEILTAQESVAAKGHTEAVDAAVAATCTEAGKTEGKHCSVCNEVLVAQTVVDALGHTEETIPAVEATCTEIGLTAGVKCSVCGEVLTAQETVAAKGHTEAVDAAIAATCTEAGKTEGKHCSVCDEILTAQESIPAVGHIAADAVIENTANASCTQAGTYDEVVYCAVCHTEMSRVAKTNAMAPHTEEIIPAVEATCTATGLTAGVKCSVCGEILTAQETVAAKGHTEAVDVAIEPTCTAGGLTEGKHCSVCNEILVAQTVLTANGHTDANYDAACDVCEEVLGSVKTANVDFTAQAYGGFLVAPGKNVAVSSNLAESYGYTDSVSYLADVSALDVLVKVHEEMFGEAFTAETADSMLAVGSSGWITTIFGSATSSCGFAVNGGFPNDGTQGDYGYNGTTVNATVVAAGDLVEFFLYQDTDMYLDNYTYTTAPESVEAGSAFTVNVKGICYMYYGSSYADGAAMKAAATKLEGVSLAVVNMATGAASDLEVETDENGNASISFAEAGTYVITAYGENVSGVPSVMTLTTVTVTEKAGIPGDMTGDGSVDSTDLSLLKRYLLNAGHKMHVTLTAEQLALADVNHDGSVDSTDASLLSRSLLPKGHRLYCPLS